MTSHSTTRHATPADSESLVTTLTEAFAVDPLMGHLWPDPDRPGFVQPAALAAFMRAAIDVYLPHGHTIHVPGRAVAVWTPPGVHADTTPLGEAVGEHTHPETREAAMGPFAEMFGLHPEEPYFYLAQIGAADAARGRGLGSLLLERTLASCDADGFLAHLEATTPRSRALYERHGFVQIAEIEFAPGVAVFPMTREPTS